MPRRLSRPSRRPAHGGGRVFADDAGRLWNASVASGTPAGAVVFACISDSRASSRAIAIEAGLRVADVADDVLRAWLRDAPRVGRLT